jgi:hypothetical protein
MRNHARQHHEKADVKGDGDNHAEHHYKIEQFIAEFAFQPRLEFGGVFFRQVVQPRHFHGILYTARTQRKRTAEGVDTPQNRNFFQPRPFFGIKLDPF